MGLNQRQTVGIVAAAFHLVPDILKGAIQHLFRHVGPICGGAGLVTDTVGRPFSKQRQGLLELLASVIVAFKLLLLTSRLFEACGRVV